MTATNAMRMDSTLVTLSILARLIPKAIHTARRFSANARQVS